jgi:hypothetical protein
VCVCVCVCARGGWCVRSHHGVAGTRSTHAAHDHHWCLAGATLRWMQATTAAVPCAAPRTPRTAPLTSRGFAFCDQALFAAATRLPESRPPSYSCGASLFWPNTWWWCGGGGVVVAWWWLWCGGGGGGVVVVVVVVCAPHGPASSCGCGQCPAPKKPGWHGPAYLDRGVAPHAKLTARGLMLRAVHGAKLNLHVCQACVCGVVARCVCVCVCVCVGGQAVGSPGQRAPAPGARAGTGQRWSCATHAQHGSPAAAPCPSSGRQHRSTLA